jgi:hypothetical protein
VFFQLRKIKVTVHKAGVSFRSFVCFVYFLLLRLILHALHELFCIKYFACVIKYLHGGVKFTLSHCRSGFVSSECLISRLVVSGICECVLYMEINWECIITADRSLAKSVIVADLNRTCCES